MPASIWCTPISSRYFAIWTFSARSYLRLIGQYVKTDRDPTLYSSAVNASDGETSLSALLAYKLNWQTVLYLGYADTRTFDDADRLQPAERQAFFKISYAFRR